MRGTVHCLISEKEIRAQRGSVSTLVDTRLPRLKFRYRQSGGSWYLTFQAEGKQRWRKLANWPEISPSGARRIALKRLEDVAIDANARIKNAEFYSVGELLHWYCERVNNNRQLSRNRKSGICSLVRRHTIPVIGDLVIGDLSKQVIDERLLQPLQTKLATGTCRQIFGILKRAFSQAHGLDLITHNPVASYNFTTFIQAPILAKPGRLKTEQAPLFLADLVSAPPDSVCFVLMILLHGSRIGETRQARWRDISFESRIWRIPVEHIKTRKKIASDHVLPLTDLAVSLLQQVKARQIKRKYIGEFIFNNRHTGRPLSSVQANTLIQQASRRHWTAHDLRKLCRSALQELNVDMVVAERVINHSLGIMQETYNHGRLSGLMLDALTRYHSWLIERDHNGLLSKYCIDSSPH